MVQGQTLFTLFKYYLFGIDAKKTYILQSFVIIHFGSGAKAYTIFCIYYLIYPDAKPYILHIIYSVHVRKLKYYIIVVFLFDPSVRITLCILLL